MTKLLGLLEVLEGDISDEEAGEPLVAIEELLDLEDPRDYLVKPLGPEDAFLFAQHWPGLVEYYHGDRQEAHRAFILADRKRLILPQLQARHPTNSPMWRTLRRQEWLLTGIAKYRAHPRLLLQRYTADTRTDSLTDGYELP